MTAAALSQALRDTKNSGAQWLLAEGLAAVAARMEPKEAAALCGQASVTLTQAMSKTTNEDALWPLAQGLSAVEEAGPQSVAELAEEGQALEAETIEGVEGAPDPDEGEVRTKQVPEDDVPLEYLHQD